jgi:flagellar motor protein MotB
MSEFDPDPEELSAREDREQDLTQLWVISYSDFMTILMIFFLMLFAHRVWEKKVSWEERRVQQLRAAQEAQSGMVQRLSKLATVDVQAERIDIQLPDALLFQSGRADLQDSARDLLSRLVPELGRFNGDIIVEGHTDDLPLGPHSPFKSNWELSVGRAFSVITYLTGKGVDPTKVSARGYGPYRPRVPNLSAENREMNRRIEIVLLNQRKGG